MSKLITRFTTERLGDADLQSKFTCLQEVLIRTQNAYNERAIALASMETVQAEMNRRRAKQHSFGF
jgi:hypothetical protein